MSATAAGAVITSGSSRPPTLKILILKPSSLGDVIQARPVLRLLKRRFPASEIYWWLASDLLPLLTGDPDLAGVIPFDRRRWAWPSNWLELLFSLRDIRQHRFDWVIDLQSLARSALVAWLARGKFTVGLDDRREGAAALYDVAVARPSYQTHAVDWYLRVLSALEVPVHWDFDWLPVRETVRTDLQRKWHPAPVPHVILHPGARWANKRWPVEHYAAVVRQLAQEDPHRRFVVLGNGKDEPLGALICNAAPGRALDLTGKTSLLEMVEWIRLGELMLTNDTGPMHVAAALGKPVVALFGPTEPRRTGPYGQLDHVVRLQLPCQPCMRSECHWPRPVECLRALMPESVTPAVRRSLHNDSGSSA